jgi:hypothetical protein
MASGRTNRGRQIVRSLWLFVLSGIASGQFRDGFDGPAIQGWTVQTGDGTAAMEFRQGEGFGSILVDATSDKRGIWWAVIKRNVSASLDLRKLQQPGHAIRIEARIRVSHAPRRVNLSLNTQKTRDFHKDLMEFDIAQTGRWETISFTDPDLRAEPGDTLNAQLALIDWGLGKYRVDVDYFSVDVVRVATAGPDKGTAVPYRPPVADPRSFLETVLVEQDSVVDLQFPGTNFNKWYVSNGAGKAEALTVGGTLWAILRWDLRRYAGRRAAGSGLLELTTHSLGWPDTGKRDFGGVRVTEIIGGDAEWRQESVTLESLTKGQPLDQVINTQMIIDIEVAEGTLPVAQGSKVWVTISRPVLQRLLDGTTPGIALRPLGPISANFYAKEFEGGRLSGRLLFNVE